MHNTLDRRQLMTAGLALAALAPLSAAQARKARREEPLRFPIRLSGNENPWGPGPKARAAIAAAIGDSCRYASEAYTKLIDAIAAQEKVDKQRIVLGSGSGELLHMLAVSFCERGQLVCAWPTFAQLPAYAEKLGCEIQKVPVDAELRHDLRALAAATTANTSLLYVCNPNNPTGTVIEGGALRRFCSEMASRTLVVCDEAYLDLVEPGSTESMVDLVRSDANVVVLRTFSKIHGLAGLRIGYAIARADIAQRLRRYQMAFPNTLGLEAARASLGDSEFLQLTRAALIADRKRVCTACDELGLRYAAPQGNFVFMRVGMPLEQFRGRMKERQIEVGRPFEPFNDWCRVTVGTTAETTVFIEALRSVIKS